MVKELNYPTKVEETYASLGWLSCLNYDKHLIYTHEFYMLTLDNMHLSEIIFFIGIFLSSHTRVLSAVKCGQQMMITS